MNSELQLRHKQYILQQIRQFVETHRDITFRMEYDKIRDKFLISYHFDKEMEDESPIWDDLINLQFLLDEDLGDYSPLSCEDDRLFKLSHRADVIKFEPVSSDVQTVCDSITLSDDFQYSLLDSEGIYDFKGGVPEYSLAA